MESMMIATDGLFRTPEFGNEPVYSYESGSPERTALQQALQEKCSNVVEIPCVVDGKRIFTGQTIQITMPSDHQHVLAIAHT